MAASLGGQGRVGLAAATGLAAAVLLPAHLSAEQKSGCWTAPPGQFLGKRQGQLGRSEAPEGSPDHSGVASAAVGRTAPHGACLALGVSFGTLAAVSTKLQRRGRGRNAVPAVIRRAMFERFAAGSMKAVMRSQAEARKLGHDQVGTEMLVVGIIAEAVGKGYQALDSLGATLTAAQDKLEAIVGRGSGGKAIEIPFTQGAKRVLEDAIEVAREDSCAQVDTGHLLRALLKQGDSVGMKLLGQLIDSQSADATKQRILHALAAEESPSKGAESSPQASPGSSTSWGAVNNVSEEIKLTETLKYAEDLTQAALDGKLDPLIGRQAQLDRTIRILGRRSKNNPIFIGEAGVGKTSIAHGLAQRIAQGRVPPTLRDKKVVQLDLALLLAGTRYRGDFEERLKSVIKEVMDSNRRVILVIDEVHTLVGAGSSGGEGGGMDAANLLKPALARGELQCIGATTLDEYRQYIEKDPALERRFQPVHVPEPTEEEAEQILLGLSPRYERHHQLRYTPAAIKAAVKLASQYIADRFLPDKAIDVMDEAGAKVRQQLFQQAESAEALATRQALSTELEAVRRQKKQAVAAEQYQEAQTFKQREQELDSRIRGLDSSDAIKEGLAQNAELQGLRAKILEAVAAERFEEACRLKELEKELCLRIGSAAACAPQEVCVTEHDVAQVVAGWTGVAVEQVSASESARLMRLESILATSVIGQKEAVSSVSRALRRARAGLRSPTRPIAALMFSGPTGVGKTELCKTLANTFFGTQDSIIRLDMSEFMEKHTISKLIGAPPGYVGFGDGGTLTEAVRRKPYSLVLFDEVEKAHPDVFNVLLQLLDDGRLTDSKGRTVSFSNTLVVLTSNIGSRAVQRGASGGNSLGFGTAENQAEASYATICELVHEEMKSFFRPEFLNRLDEMVVFRPLSKDNIRDIAEVELRKVVSRLEARGVTVSLTQRFKEHVVTAGYDPAYGARPLRRAITRLLEDNLAEHILDAFAEEPDSKDDNTSSPAGRRALVDVMEDGRIKVHALRKDKPVLA